MIVARIERLEAADIRDTDTRSRRLARHAKDGSCALPGKADYCFGREAVVLCMERSALRLRGNRLLPHVGSASLIPGGLYWAAVPGRGADERAAERQSHGERQPSADQADGVHDHQRHAADAESVEQPDRVAAGVRGEETPRHLT